jgi:hypothetical protein
MPNHAAVLQKFFGRKPGQSLPDFLAEVRQLSESEKQELVDAILALAESAATAA